MSTIARGAAAGAADNAARATSGGDRVVRFGMRFVMPLTDLLTSTVAFVLTVVGVALAVGLVPLFLLGFPLFFVVGALQRGMAEFEKGRVRLFLGIDIPRAPARRRGMRAALTDEATWRAIAYEVVRFPVAAATFAICYGAWGGSLALLSMPAWLHRFPAKQADFGFLTLTNEAGAWVAVAVGVVLVVVALGLTVALTSVEGALARGLLGTSPRQLARRVGELQDSRSRVVDAAEAERRRIERDLHDGAQQRLVALAMNLGRARARYDDDPEAAQALVAQAHDDAKLALTELRDLARGLHPAVLSDRGLQAALSGVAARAPVPVTLDVSVEPRCSPTVEAIAYFVVSEALTNAVKHANASRIDVVARRIGERLHVEIRDDGVGGADRTGSGLSGLADRVGGVDGSLHVDSPPGGPTVLSVELPCVS